MYLEYPTLDIKNSLKNEEREIKGNIHTDKSLSEPVINYEVLFLAIWWFAAGKDHR